MFFQYTEKGLVTVDPQKIDRGTLTAGYVTVEELLPIAAALGFDDSTVEACRNANRQFRSGVEVHRDYTFTELRILTGAGDDEDYIALFLRRNLILIVDIEDADGSTKEKFHTAIRRYDAKKVCCEKILYAFLDALLTGEHKILEDISTELEQQEEILTGDRAEKDFNRTLLESKKRISLRYSYYGQLQDIADEVSENDNDIFDEENLIYIDNASKKIARLKEEAEELKSTVQHLQDAYSSNLDIKMNNTMKIFTILTSIFFPLTVIVGWYGMNFQTMPELQWKYGYVYVIALSVVTVLILAIIGKKKKWF